MVIPIFCFGLACGLPQWFNNRQLQRFADNLYNYPLPPRTEIIDRQAEVTLRGNGNHCDFVVKQSLASELARQEVETFYQNVRLPAVSDQSPNTQDGLISVGLLFDKEPLPDGRLRFIIALYDIGYDPGFDIRCH